MTIEEKARAYDEAVKKINDYYEGKTKMYSDIEQTLDLLFPELKKSEDERIRKALIEYFTTSDNNSYYAVGGVATKKILAWLEKQGNHADNVEQKFNVGNWIAHNKANFIFKIINVGSNGYEVVNRENCKRTISFDNEDKYHLWTIADAKPGDVLCWNDSKCVALFKNIYDKESFNSYGFVGHCTSAFESRLSYHDIEGAHPATKEQRDLLFQKMKEAGYEWDDVKKELKKIHVIDDGKAEGEQKLANSTKTCNDEDTLLSLLQQMPSCITVDGIDYHFVLKKTIAYMIFYEGEGEGSGKVIFWMAGEPVDICKEMLKRLEKEGLI